MLTIRNLSKTYDGPRGRRVLDNIHLDLAAGEYIAIMGESGIGKSTLLNLIAGLDLPEAGSIHLDGVEITALNETERTLLRRREMGFVFQAFHLLPHLTVAQNVALPLSLIGVPQQGARERVGAILQAVGLAEFLDSYPRELSGGEMQRVAIARALAHHPKLVLADEPTGNLDTENGALVLDLLRSQIAAGDGAGILVTHSHTAAASASRVYVLTCAGLALRENAP